MEETEQSYNNSTWWKPTPCPRCGRPLFRTANGIIVRCSHCSYRVGKGSIYADSYYPRGRCFVCGKKAQELHWSKTDGLLREVCDIHYPMLAPGLNMYKRFKELSAKTLAEWEELKEDKDARRDETYARVY